jgi:biopolymer transport protein ExbD
MPIKTTPLDDIPALNLTSMIDVLFLLIIFFMVGTKFIESERQIELEVPRVGNSGALTAPPDKKLINIYRDGQIELDHKTVSLDELGRRLSAARGQYKRLGVLVRGDGNTPLQQVANVLGACKQAGIADLGISVRLAGSEGPNARR